MSDRPELEPWEVLASEMALDHRWYRVRRDTVRFPSGQVVDDYFISERPEIVLIFAVTPDQRVELVRQYKHGPKAVTLEFPGGIMDPDEDDPLGAAQRELAEESGVEASEWTALGAIWDDPSKQNNRLHLFLAQNARRVKVQELDSSEFVIREQADLKYIPRMIYSGDINNSGAIALATRALQALGLFPI